MFGQHQGAVRVDLRRGVVAFVFLMAMAASGRAQIYRWDTGEVIEHTEQIHPGRGVNFPTAAGTPERDGFAWLDLRYADFSHLDLRHASFNFLLGGTDLRHASFRNTDLTGVNFHFSHVGHAEFTNTTGFTESQLMSTRSYQAKNLTGIGLGIIDLTGWDLSEQNLTDARLIDSNLTDANLSGANLTNASLSNSWFTNANLSGAVVTGVNLHYATLRGFTQSQLASTASYRTKNLKGIQLTSNDLTGWDLNGQDLTNAVLSGSNLTDANLSGAVVTRANFAGTRGLTPSQLVSTASYQVKNLTGVGLQGLDLAGWDLSGQNLTDASLSSSTLMDANLSGANLTNAILAKSILTDADLSGAVVTRANFAGTRGFTPSQLVSTASYQMKNLTGIGLQSFDLSGRDLSGQNLTDASLSSSTLMDANLSGANLTNAELSYSTLTDADLSEANLTSASLFFADLTNADLSGAVVTGASFHGTSGLTQSRLASTASYLAKNLAGVRLAGIDLTGWDLSGQNLSNASFSSQAFLPPTSLANANLSGANLVNADLSKSTLTNTNLSGANLTNANFSYTIHFGGVLLVPTSLAGTDLSETILKNVDLGLAMDIDLAVFSSNTIYNQWTVFPAEFDPIASGLTQMLSPLGDFNANDVLDVADIEMLEQRIRRSLLPSWLPDAMFDVNSDGSVDQDDMRGWVMNLKHTWLGDANLDGEFDSADLVLVFEAGQYETTERFSWGGIANPATWSTGDWNTDGEFTSSDLVLAFQDGGYEAGPRATVVAVPEPGGFFPPIVGLCGLLSVACVRRKPPVDPMSPGHGSWTVAAWL
jgi:uncharacterized protein YjbI with pentapeptide repeats